MRPSPSIGCCSACWRASSSSLAAAGVGTSTPLRPGQPLGFLLERGRFKPVAIPRGLEDLALQGIVPFNINDRGRVVGLAPIADATPSPQPTSTPPRDGMSGS
jgi:hypothetical protein